MDFFEKTGYAIEPIPDLTGALQAPRDTAARNQLSALAAGRRRLHADILDAGLTAVPQYRHDVTPAAAGWVQIGASGFEWAQLQSCAEPGRKVYVVLNGRETPQGTGADTRNAFILAEGRAILAPITSLWYYATGAYAVRWGCGAHWFPTSSAPDQVIPAEEAPTGTPDSKTNITTTSVTILAAAPRRVTVILENYSAVDAFLNLGGTALVNKGVWLPAGRKIELNGIAAKGNICGITASGTATVYIQTLDL